MVTCQLIIWSMAAMLRDSVVVVVVRLVALRAAGPELRYKYGLLT